MVNRIASQREIRKTELALINDTVLPVLRSDSADLLLLLEGRGMSRQ